MMAQGTQKKLERVRPPRVSITYEVETGGAIEMKELPFVMGVLADLSGNPAQPLPRIKERKFVEISKGTLGPAQYDATVRDLVNFLVYVGEPAAADRRSIGIAVLFVLLGVIFPLAYWMKKEFWKDVK
jgi:type VI secretion system protein ImpB